MNLKTIDKRIKDLMILMGQEEEIMLYRWTGNDIECKWKLHIGNPSQCVCLGEVDGILVFEGDSIKNVLSQAEARFRQGK
jgi:hypothetical protein